MQALTPRHSRARSSNRRSTRVRMEPLEVRALLSAITGYTIDATFPAGIAEDVNDRIWIADATGLYQMSENGVQISVVTSQYQPFDVVFNPSNDHLYFSDISTGGIGEVTLGGDLINFFQPADPFTEAPTRLTVASDGAVWFSCLNSSEIGRLDGLGNITMATITEANVTANNIVAGENGSVWFNAFGNGAQDEFGNTVIAGNACIGHAVVNNDGSITQDQSYVVSTPGSLPTGLAVASDGSLWFSLANRGTVYGGPSDGPDRIVHGVVSGDNLLQTEYVLPGATESSASNPGSVGLDNAGRVWFIEQMPARISYLDSATGTFVELGVPAEDGTPVNMIVEGGHVWTTSWFGSANVLKINLSGFTSPISASTPNLTATTGTQLTGSIAFQTDDAGPYTYVIDYGDGQSATGTVESDGSGSYAVPVDVTYAAAGNYATKLAVMTADGNVITLSGVAIVSDPVTENVEAQGINLSGQQDVALASNMTVDSTQILAVATFTGPDAPYTAVIDWADGTTSDGTIYSLGDGVYAVGAPTKTYTANGTYAGTVTISGGPNVAVANFVATISDTALVVSTGLQLELTRGRLFNGTVALFSDDIESTTSSFTATIDWGNGKVTTGTIVADDSSPGQYYVTGVNLYTGKKTTYLVQITITNTVEGTTSVATAYITL